MALVEHLQASMLIVADEDRRLLNGPAVDWEHTQRERRKKKKR